MEKLRVLVLALIMLVINLVGISPAQAATFNCETGGTYTVEAGHITGSSSCSGRLVLDASVTEIDNFAFFGHWSGSRITELVIPSTVSTIGSYAFYGNGYLTSISVANSVTTIGESAFGQSKNVTELTIGSGVTRIANDTYQQFEYFTKLVIPEGITQIDPGAFSEWFSITSLTLPSTLTNLGFSSLRRMRSLRSINIPSGLSTANDFFGYIGTPSSVPYLCSTTGSSLTPAVNTYFATLISVNTNAGRCSNSFNSPTITSVAFPSSTSATVNFTPPTNFGAGTAIGSYSVVAFPGGKRATVSGAAARSVTLSSLTSGTEYTFEVNAINNEGSAITSPPSARSASVTCCSVSTTAPGAPTIGTATALSPTSASISFTAPISDGGATIETYTATSTPGSFTGRVLQSGSGSITVTGLTPSIAYTFRVTASNSAGTSSASGATVSITMPASAEELAAQTAAAAAAKAAAELAAQKEAEAKRVAEKKAARTEISKGFSGSKMPTIQQFATAEITGVTEKNLPMISKELMAMPEADRSDLKMVEKVSTKYLILDIISSGGKFTQFFAKDLSNVGLIPVENQVVVTYALRQMPLAERDNYEKITAAISKELAVIRIRDERLASILALRKSRQVG